jgi:heptosyltransferase I
MSAAKPGVRILVVRLGALGDIIHTLPAGASLKASFPEARLTWIVEPRWAPLLEGNPFVDRIALLRRGSARGLYRSWRELRGEEFDSVVDFQGLIKSAAVAGSARSPRVFGFDESQLRERLAAAFYTDRVRTSAAHVVDRNLELARAAGAGVTVHEFPLPTGKAEGDLPEGDFVLASPLAGWKAKQWPLEYYEALAGRLKNELGIPLVIDAPVGAALGAVAGALQFHSSLAGLIHATRRAAAVVGVDSGPVHIAAALGKPGVAVFGPTDPERNGPYGGSITILRSPSAITTYRRGTAIDASMSAISPDQVFAVLRERLACLPHDRVS